MPVTARVSDVLVSPHVVVAVQRFAHIGVECSDADMSLIASFWTIDLNERNQIVDRFKPIERSVGRKSWLLFGARKTETEYPWLDYLQAYAVEQASFEYSGSAIVDFDLILSAKYESIFAMGLPESETLSEYSGSSVAFLDNDARTKAAHAIGTLDLTGSEVERYYDSDEKPPEWRPDPDVVVEAGNHLKRWLGAITNERYGILMIG